jgi:ribosomal protein S18 acetylase RimI-like enzyme
MQSVDKAFARRLESAEEMPQVDIAHMYQVSRPEIGAAVEEICGGHMIFAGLNSPIGRAVGLGFADPITDADLNRVEDFYRSHGAPAQIDVCPLHDMELLETLKRRGYVMAELNNVLYRALDPQEQFPDGPAEVEIRRGRLEEASAFSDIVTRCFFEKGDAPEGFAELLAPLFQGKDTMTFVVTLDGTPVAVAAGQVIPQHRVVALFGAGTLAEYRRRGLQTALFRHRLQAAAASGCEVAVVVTRGGTVSQRNAERLGFRVAYSKATLLKDFENASPKAA